MIKLRWNSQWLDYEKIEWSGTDTQASRQISFTIPWNPYDKEFANPKIDLGDLVYLYDDKKCIFTGQITSRGKNASIGTAPYVAKDFMHHLLGSTTSRKFKNKSPENITESVCKEVGVQTTALAKTGINIPKMICEEMSCYDIIIKAYRKARAKTKKNYMPSMVGKKVSVIVKGEDSGITLDQSTDIIDANYSENTDSMINVVKIFDEKNKKVGTVKSTKTYTSSKGKKYTRTSTKTVKKTSYAELSSTEKVASQKKYGIYQAVYRKEKGVDSKKAAKALLQGVSKEASVEALGYIKCISGRSVKISDKATGLTGKFYITGDTHTFENGVHTMKLDLEQKETMESTS